ILFACQTEDKDFQEIQAAHQAIINQIGHSWQISELSITTENGDTSHYNLGVIRFVPCKTTRQNAVGCNEGGTYQVGQKPEITFDYNVNATTRQVQILVPEQSRTIENVDNLSDNWEISKVSEDSLILSHGGYRVRTLKLTRE
ncbi:MAG: hypothetical protein ACLFQO_15025, partial [Cyclobacteriaceae bacterium]